ncbi:MAG: SUMF1/EgtB/PvdO family nonheme iron enzyme [Thermodesulfobacteriota bacterium]
MRIVPALLLAAALAWAAVAAAREPLRDPETGIAFVRVPGGCFEMGDAIGAGEEDEGPAREVCLRDFAIMPFEVTTGQYARFVNATGYATRAEREGFLRMRAPGGAFRREGGCWRRQGFVQDSTHPVVGLAPEDAESFAAWVAARTGLRVLLPTEAQWEYAARAGGRRRDFATQNGDMSPDLANLAGTGGRDRFPATAPAGSFPPNLLGLYDMSGNAAEWVRDAYNATAYAAGPGRDPLVPPVAGQPRAKRGGSFALPAAFARCANRGFGEDGVNDTGFRLVVEP